MMWQDDFITERNGYFICWDYNGEFITIRNNRDDARNTITNFKDLIKRKDNGKVIQ